METEEYYLRARSYDPRRGRFTSKDIILNISQVLPAWQKVVDPHSLNLYTYCYNDLIRYLDPSGHTVKDLLDSFASFGAGAISGFGEGISVGVTGLIEESINSVPPPNEIFYQVGKILGNIGAGVVGFLEAGAGAVAIVATDGVALLAGAGTAVTAAVQSLLLAELQQ